MKYVLKATTQDGDYYYMNVICVTQQIENAEHYSDKEEAKKDIEHFKNMFFYEDVEPVIEEYEEFDKSCKGLHNQDVEQAKKACLDLDNENKKALCDYLKKTVEFMESELNGMVADWSNLPYLKKDSGADKAFQTLVDITISWKYDESDIIALDKEIIALLERS